MSQGYSKSLPDFSLNPSNEYYTTKKRDVVLIGSKIMYLNKSKCKFVAVGLSHEDGLVPHIVISGNKGDQASFNEEDFERFLSYQGIITNYLYSNDHLESIDEGEFILEFLTLPKARVVKIIKGNSCVYLAYESICKLWELLPLIKYRADMLKRCQFSNYYKIVRKGLQKEEGDVFRNALNLLDPHQNPNSENISLVLELMCQFPEIFVEECSNRELV